MRLYQGDYDRETVFSENPIEVALQWQSMGAPRLHIVDLDGAKTGELANLEIIKEIAGAILIPTELGGGIRRIEDVELLLKAGIERVILGTVAVENPELVKTACKQFSDSIIVGIDTRDGVVATHGWRKETQLKAADFARSMAKLGVKRFIYTDITRDGTLTEPNFAGFSELLHEIRIPVIASGGVSTLNHIRMLKQLGAEGAIIGRALYTGDIKLKEALAVVSG